MDRVSILDCTLRDGGYINDFNFGQITLKNIIRKLTKASIDIIECGFLKSGAFDPNCSLYGSVESIREVIGHKNTNLMYVGMIQYGAISNEEISEYDATSIDGIRITFHEHEIEDAFFLGRQLMDKGYRIFMQPVGTMTYTDEALLHLIFRINELKPFAFYLVDTLGTMYKNDLLRMFYLVDNNLHKNISLGFHSHNNLQLSFANAQELIQLNTPRRLIIDSSVFGMGRGAGNLNTELMTQYINFNFKLKYDNLEILEIIDEYIRPLSLKYRWGYDAAYYIASVAGCHPNYATFLMNKQTLHAKDIHIILSNLKNEKRALFDKEYIANEYLKYLSHHINDSDTQQKIYEELKDKNILLLAPGKSLKKKVLDINTLISKGNYYIFSVNFIPTDIKINAVFISNMRRFKCIEELIKNSVKDTRIVITSNITTETDDKLSIIDFSSYINEEQCIVDNAGLMCINFLKKIGVKKITLAGFDGFTTNFSENYYEQSMAMDVEAERLMNVNIAMSKKILQLKKQMDITFLTESAYKK